MAAFESFSVIILILGLSAIGYSQEDICKTCCGDNGGFLEVLECAVVECACPTTTTAPKPVPICEDCCSDNPTNPRCRFNICRCPNKPVPPLTKKPASCETCCGPSASTDKRCETVDCDCSPYTTTTTALPFDEICRSCCASSGPYDPRCETVRCFCPFKPVPPPTEKPATCETCCGPLAHTVPRCAIVRCDCSPYTTTTTAKPSGGPCGLCCSPEGAGNPQCIGIRCACPARLDDPTVGPCGNCCSPAGATNPACQNNKCVCPSQPSS